MSTIELHVAEVYLDGLIERVEAGETITITRQNVPVATIAPIPRAQGAGDADPRRSAKSNRLVRLSLRQPRDLAKP